MKSKPRPVDQDLESFRRIREIDQKREAEEAKATVMTPAGFQPRLLVQPLQRVDFPFYFGVDVLSPGASPHVGIQNALIAAGENPDEIKRITIAYPHKHPDLFPGHVNHAKESAREMADLIKKLRRMDRMPYMHVVLADAICENVHLNRKWKKGIVYSLAGKQEYSLCMDLQKEHLPFLDPKNKQKEYFLIADHAIETGTTVANLASFIQGNGGHVLGAIIELLTENSDCHFLQDKDLARLQTRGILKKPFNDASRNTAALPVLAETFFASARKYKQPYASPQACMERFEEALNKVGHSVFTLTQGECRRILEELRGEAVVYTEGNDKGRKAPEMPFHKLISRLEARAMLGR